MEVEDLMQDPLTPIWDKLVTLNCSIVTLTQQTAMMNLTWKKGCTLHFKHPLDDCTVCAFCMGGYLGQIKYNVF